MRQKRKADHTGRWPQPGQLEPEHCGPGVLATTSANERAVHGRGAAAPSGEKPQALDPPEGRHAGCVRVASIPVASDNDSNLATGPVRFRFSELSLPASVWVRHSGAKWHSPGAVSRWLSRIPGNAHGADRDDNEQCWLHTRCAACHPALFVVLVQRGDGLQDSAESHQLGEETRFQASTPYALFGQPRACLGWAGQVSDSWPPAAQTSELPRTRWCARELDVADDPGRGGDSRPID